MGPTTIREAELADVPDILRVTERSWNAAYDELLPQETIDGTMEKLRRSDVTRGHVERDDVAFFVAERSGDVVGYVSGGPGDDANVAVLGALYVDPDRWNEGVGTALLREFEARCRGRGASRIRFTVLAGNEIGASFYRKHGYAAVDERSTDRFGEPVTERVFRGDVQ